MRKKMLSAFFCVVEKCFTMAIFALTRIILTKHGDNCNNFHSSPVVSKYTLYAVGESHCGDVWRIKENKTNNIE